jgi:hypothetical protein
MPTPFAVEIALDDEQRAQLASWARRRNSSWFSELTSKKLRRGAHRSVRELNTDIRSWIENWNENPKPFVWTKTSDQILDSIARYCDRINESRH